MELRNEYGDKNAYEAASCWSKLLFSWASPVLGYSKKYQLDIEDLGTIRESHDVRVQQGRLVTAWNGYKRSGSKHSLFKAVLRAYRWEYTVAVLWNLLVCALQIISPFVLRRLILFVRERAESTSEGLVLVSLLTLSQGLAYVLSEHIVFYARMTGVKSTNAMIALICDKAFKVSSATNKKFAQGQLVNFVQDDAVKLQWLCS